MFTAWAQLMAEGIVDVENPFSDVPTADRFGEPILAQKPRVWNPGPDR